jgi:hypothetical protein
MSERLTRQSRLSLPARRCGTRPRLPRASPSSSVLPRRALCARSTSTSADGTGPTAEDRKDWWGSGLWRRDCFRVYGASCGFRVVVAALGPGGRPRAWGTARVPECARSSTHVRACPAVACRHAAKSCHSDDTPTPCAPRHRRGRLGG